MLPVIARNLLESIRLLAAVSRVFADKCIAGIEADVERCRDLRAVVAVDRHLAQPVHRLRGGGQGHQGVVAEGKDLRTVVLERGLLVPRRRSTGPSTWWP